MGFKTICKYSSRLNSRKMAKSVGKYKSLIFMFGLANWFCMEHSVVIILACVSVLVQDDSNKNFNFGKLINDSELIFQQYINSTRRYYGNFKAKNNIACVTGCHFPWIIVCFVSSQKWRSRKLVGKAIWNGNLHNNNKLFEESNSATTTIFHIINFDFSIYTTRSGEEDSSSSTH